MLSSMHKIANSTFMKLFLGLIVASFALWGIGDVFRKSEASHGVVKVGENWVSVAEYKEALDRELQTYRKMLGKDYNPELIKMMNIPQQVLERLIQQHLIKEEAMAQGLVVPESFLADNIKNNKNFAGPDGKFNGNVFKQVLASNNFSEKRYLDLLSKESVANILLQSTFSGISVPDSAAELAYKYQNESRVADVLLLSDSMVKAVAEPTDAQLQDVYKENEARFAQPELRSFSMVALNADTLAKSITFKDEDLLIEYQKRIESYREPEKREVNQLLFEDEATAKKAHAALVAGMSIDEAAKEFKPVNADHVLLGTVTAAGMIPEASKSVFELQKKGISAPIQSSFGWHLFQVIDIKPAQTRPFAEVKEELTETLRSERTGDEIYNLSTALQDDLAAGTSIEEAAKKVGGTVTGYVLISEDGKDKNGKAAAIPEQYDELLKSAYELNEGETSSILETKDGSYYAVYVSAVQPQVQRPLAEVRETVSDMWKSAEKHKKLLEMANGLAVELKEKSAEDVAKTSGAKLVQAKTLTRAHPELGDGVTLSSPMMASLFSLEPGQATGAFPAGQHYAVAKLVSINPAKIAGDEAKAGIANAKENLRGVYADEMFLAYMAYLRDKHGVSSVNEKLVNETLQ